MSVILVDDQTLGRVLRGERVREVSRHDVATTGLWYLRLCQAIERDAGGVLSEPFARLTAERRAQLVERVSALPHDIALVSLRQLAPVMATQHDPRRRLNLLGREVVAAATVLPADLVVAPTNLGPRLATALEAHGRRVSFTRV